MSLRVSDLDVTIGKNHILKAVSLEVKDKEFLSLLGESGSGKSTLLKCIAGVIAQNKGKIYIDDNCVDGVSPNMRNVIIVFQDLRLFPNMNLWENVAFPLKMRNVSKTERKKFAYELLKKVGLAGIENRRISEISGGQKQRVALARAFAAKPKYLLLDEPFSSLDENIKVEMRELLMQLYFEFEITIILVTHDKNEALMLSDRVAIIKDGEILSCDTPVEIFSKPKNLEIAKYFGEANLLQTHVEKGLMKSDIFHCKVDLPDGNYTCVIRYNAIDTDFSSGNYVFVKSEYLGDKVKIYAKKNDYLFSFYSNFNNLKKEFEQINVKFEFDKFLTYNSDNLYMKCLYEL